MAAGAPAHGGAGAAAAALSALGSPGPAGAVSAGAGAGAVGRGGEGPGSLLLRALALAAALAAAAAQEAAPAGAARSPARALALPVPGHGLRAAQLPPQESKGPPADAPSTAPAPPHTPSPHRTPPPQTTRQRGGKNDRAALAAQQLVAARAFLHQTDEPPGVRGATTVAETIAARAAELAAATAEAVARVAGDGAQAHNTNPNDTTTVAPTMTRNHSPLRSHIPAPEAKDSVATVRTASGNVATVRILDLGSKAKGGSKEVQTTDAAFSGERFKERLAEKVSSKEAVIRVRAFDTDKSSTTQKPERSTVVNSSKNLTTTHAHNTGEKDKSSSGRDSTTQMPHKEILKDSTLVGRAAGVENIKSGQPLERIYLKEPVPTVERASNMESAKANPDKKLFDNSGATKAPNREHDRTKDVSEKAMTERSDAASGSSREHIKGSRASVQTTHKDRVSQGISTTESEDAAHPPKSVPTKHAPIANRAFSEETTESSLKKASKGAAVQSDENPKISKKLGKRTSEEHTTDRAGIEKDKSLSTSTKINSRGTSILTHALQDDDTRAIASKERAADTSRQHRTSSKENTKGEHISEKKSSIESASSDGKIINKKTNNNKDQKSVPSPTTETPKTTSSTKKGQNNSGERASIGIRGRLEGTPLTPITSKELTTNAGRGAPITKDEVASRLLLDDTSPITARALAIDIEPATPVHLSEETKKSTDQISSRGGANANEHFVPNRGPGTETYVGDETTSNKKSPGMPLQSRGTAMEVGTRAFELEDTALGSDELVAGKSLDTFIPDATVSARHLPSDEKMTMGNLEERFLKSETDTTGHAPSSLELENAEEATGPSARMYEELPNSKLKQDEEAEVTRHLGDTVLAARAWDGTGYGTGYASPRVDTAPRALDQSTIIAERSWGDIAHGNPGDTGISERSFVFTPVADSARSWNGPTPFIPTITGRSWGGQPLSATNVPIGMGSRYIGHEPMALGVTPWGMHTMPQTSYAAPISGRMIDYGHTDPNVRPWDGTIAYEVKTPPSRTAERILNDTVEGRMDPSAPFQYEAESTDRYESSQSPAVRNRHSEMPQPRLLPEQDQSLEGRKSSAENMASMLSGSSITGRALDVSKEESVLNKPIASTNLRIDSSESIARALPLDSTTKTESVNERQVDFAPEEPVTEHSSPGDEAVNTQIAVPRALGDVVPQTEPKQPDRGSLVAKGADSTATESPNPEEVAGRLLDDIARAAAEAVRALEKNKAKMGEESSSLLERLLENSETPTGSETAEAEQPVQVKEINERIGVEDAVSGSDVNSTATEGSLTQQRSFAEATDLSSARNSNGQNSNLSSPTAGDVSRTLGVTAGSPVAGRMFSSSDTDAQVTGAVATDSNADPSLRALNIQGDVKTPEQSEGLLGDNTGAQSGLAVRSDLAHSGALSANDANRVALDTSRKPIAVSRSLGSPEISRTKIEDGARSSHVQPLSRILGNKALNYPTIDAVHGLVSGSSRSFNPSGAQYMLGPARVVRPEPTHQTLSSVTQASRRGITFEPTRRASYVNVDVKIGPKSKNCIPGSLTGEMCSRRAGPTRKSNNRRHHHHHHHHHRHGSRYNSRTDPETAEHAVPYFPPGTMPFARTTSNQRMEAVPLDYGARNMGGAENGGGGGGASVVPAAPAYNGRTDGAGGSEMRFNTYPSYDYGYAGRSGYGNYHGMYPSFGHNAGGGSMMFANPYADFYIR